MGLFDRKKDELEAQEITNLKEQVNKLKAELTEAENHAAFLERQNEGYKNEKSLITQRLNAAQARVVELEKQVKAGTASVSDAQEENQAGSDTAPAVQVGEQAKISATSETQTEKTPDTSEIEALKAELSRLKAINLDPNGEFNRIRAERDNLLNAVSVLKEKISKATIPVESTEAIKTLEDERDSYAEALDNCNILLSTVKKAKTELQDKNKKLQVEVSELTDKLSDTESLLSDLKTKYSGTEQALNSAKTELSALKSKYSDAERSLQDLKSAQTELSDLKSKYSDLEQSLQAAQSELTTVKRENEKLNKIKDVLRQVEHINEG